MRQTATGGGLEKVCDFIWKTGGNFFANIEADVTVDPAQLHPRTVMEINGAWGVSNAYEMIVKDGKLHFAPIANP